MMIRPSTLFTGEALEAMKQGATSLHTSHPDLDPVVCLEIICGGFIAYRSSTSFEHWMKLTLHVVVNYVPEMLDENADADNAVAIANDVTSFVYLLQTPHKRPQ
jgi:hypothetical protein